MNYKKTGGPTKTASNTTIRRYQSNRPGFLKPEKRDTPLACCSELQQLKVDFYRLLNGYKQLGFVHAELLLDQPKVWREYLINDVYVKTLHADICDDVGSFLKAAEQLSRIKGSNK